MFGLHGGLAERRGNGLQIRVHGFKSRTHLQHPPQLKTRAIGAAVARFLDTEEVTGSNPVSPTITKPVLTCSNSVGAGFVVRGHGLSMGIRYRTTSQAHTEVTTLWSSSSAPVAGRNQPLVDQPGLGSGAARYPSRGGPPVTGWFAARPATS